MSAMQNEKDPYHVLNVSRKTCIGTKNAFKLQAEDTTNERYIISTDYRVHAHSPECSV